LGDGQGKFTPVATPNVKGLVAVGDFNGDGRLDLVGLEIDSNSNVTVSVYLQTDRP
jgi:hypothetical protein